MKTKQWILKESKLPWLNLDINIPFKEILLEAKKLKKIFVSHRAEDEVHGYKHAGWKSICIHGISAHKTNHYTTYGYKSNEQTPYKWTEIAPYCPITVDFFKNYYPCDKYYRLRFMLLEPEGFIAPHSDTIEHVLSPVNIALNHPTGCIMKMVGHGTVPFKEGEAYLLDVGNFHSYYNKSKEDRYHIIVHGHYSNNKEWKKLIETSYQKNGIK